MATIIGGLFGNIAQAEQALEDLLQHGFHRHDLSLFHVNAPGQHDTFPVGGDQDADPQAEDSHVDAVKGAAAGAAIGVAVAAAGPAALAVAVAVGAYTGALSGVLGGMTDSTREPQRGAGVMLAINTIDADRERRALELLKRHEAQDVERAEGVWRNGQWVDFDPVATPDRVHSSD